MLISIELLTRLLQVFQPLDDVIFASKYIIGWTFPFESANNRILTIS
jgi:hypothetical protein